MYAIVDCNNFYASCERLFRPDLKDKPVVVLSNNDGCIIARSNEAKDLGLKMGEPFFKREQFLRDHQVTVFSSNYALYGDLSARVFSIIHECWPEVSMYSIDEAFLALHQLPYEKLAPFCEALITKVYQYTGIPISIGLGKTKTLAKLGSYLTKKIFNQPFFILEDKALLKQIEISNIWGVGRALTHKLNALSIDSAHDLSQQDSTLMRRKFSINLARTIDELNGIDCIDLDESGLRQSIVVSKSFGQKQSEKKVIASALAAYCEVALFKLHKLDLTAQSITVFIEGCPYANRYPYANKMRMRLSYKTEDLLLINQQAQRILDKIYRTGFVYKKVGIILEYLKDKHQEQLSLFNGEDNLVRMEQLKKSMGEINARYGQSGIHLARSISSPEFAMRQDFKSPHYTTSWSALPIVK